MEHCPFGFSKETHAHTHSLFTHSHLCPLTHTLTHGVQSSAYPRREAPRKESITERPGAVAKERVDQPNTWERHTSEEVLHTVVDNEEEGEEGDTDESDTPRSPGLEDEDAGENEDAEEDAAGMAGDVGLDRVESDGPTAECSACGSTAECSDTWSVRRVCGPVVVVGGRTWAFNGECVEADDVREAAADAADEDENDASDDADAGRGADDDTEGGDGTDADDGTEVGDGTGSRVGREDDTEENGRKETESSELKASKRRRIVT
jgi:hypothetical protein